MTDRVRPYLFYDVAISICSTCFRKVEGKIVFEGGNVFLLKRCPAHGNEKILLADDVDYYRRCREVFIKPPEMPAIFNTPVKWGCPYDCGLCTDHQQHSCLSLIEICDYCNLRCPVCYAESGPERQQFRSLEQIEKMLDAVVRNEREPDVVQISGGEPTLHPDFFRVLDLAKARPIRHLMVNTNGIRIATDEAFAERLASYMPDLEIYLQFDSFEREALIALRGSDLRRIREQAIERLNRLNVSTTLVVTLQKGLNDHEIGGIIDYALAQPCVRGVTFQPIQAAGRLDNFDPATMRLTLSEVRRRILEQSSVFRPEDLIPVPCHPDTLAMAYALKIEGRVVPLTGMIDPGVLINGGRNTILY
ncbi:MAG: radical SAM protein, partial [Candidatus Acidiferrales bacterium]